MLRKKISLMISLLIVAGNIFAAAKNVTFIQCLGVTSGEMRVACDYVNLTFGVKAKELCGDKCITNLEAVFLSEPRQVLGDSAVVIKLVSFDSPENSVFRSFYTNNIAVINLFIIQPTNNIRQSISALYAKRIQRVAVYAVGRAIGLPPCPTIFCAMYPSSSSQEFDAKAINLCPPCLLRAQRDLQSQGVIMRKSR
jgi:predicted Zn-dependent protease